MANDIIAPVTITTAIITAPITIASPVILSAPVAVAGLISINWSDLSVYVDNTAALVGGLVAGVLYRTAAGELRVVY